MAYAPDIETGAFLPGAGRKSVIEPSRIQPDAPLRDILNKHGDRLLRDAGLTREDLLGERDHVLKEIARQRALWRL